MTFLEAWMQDISSVTLSGIALMALAGAIVGVAPSSYPLLAVGAGISAAKPGDGTARRSRAIFLACGFVLGIALVDAALGALFGALGFIVMRTLAAVMAPVYFALSVLLLVMGLALLRVIRFDLRLLYAAPRAITGFWSAFVLGIPFGLSTCPACTPMLLPVMLAAGATGDALMGGTLLFVFGLARGIPIIIVGAASDILPRMLPVSLWIPRIEQGAGMLLLVASAAFAYQASVYAGWLPVLGI